MPASSETASVKQQAPADRCRFRPAAAMSRARLTPISVAPHRPVPGRARRPARPASRFPAASRARFVPSPRPAPPGWPVPAAVPSARTSSRFATFAQAINSTMPDGPHQHPQRVADIAHHFLLQRLHIGTDARVREQLTLKPGGGGNRSARSGASAPRRHWPVPASLPV